MIVDDGADELDGAVERLASIVWAGRSRVNSTRPDAERIIRTFRHAESTKGNPF